MAPKTPEEYGKLIDRKVENAVKLLRLMGWTCKPPKRMTFEQIDKELAEIDKLAFGD